MGQIDQDFEDVDRRVADANAKLKALLMGVVIERRGGRLALRAVLPPKPGSKATRPHQQRLALGIRANVAGVRRALNLAKQLGGGLDQFRWEDWGKDGPEDAGEGLSVRDAIARFEEWKRPHVAPATWNSYRDTFRLLPMDEPISKELLESVLRKIDPSKHWRGVALNNFRQLAKDVGIELDVERLRSAYRHSAIEPRRLPTDAEIVATRNSIKSPRWQYLYGLLAAYGLRPHEAFYLAPDSLATAPGVARVLEGKTGSRIVFPCYPEWWELWGLDRYDLMPNVKFGDHATAGQRVTDFFARNKLPRAYYLRHRWAVRTSEFGWPVELAARQMGHDLAVHTKTYHRCLGDDTQSRVWQTLMARDDRPRPPE